MADAILRTARRVRIGADHALHTVARAHDTAHGRTYDTRCGQRFTVAQHGAVLSTREATCGQCSRRTRVIETVGELADRLPPGEWVNLPEYGVSVKAWPEAVPS